MTKVSKEFETVVTETKVPRIVLTLSVEEASGLRHLLYSGAAGATVKSLGLKPLNDLLGPYTDWKTIGEFGPFHTTSYLAKDNDAAETEKANRNRGCFS